MSLPPRVSLDILILRMSAADTFMVFVSSLCRNMAPTLNVQLCCVFLWPLCANATLSSRKSEVHNQSQQRPKRAEPPRPCAICAENLLMFGPRVSLRYAFI